MTGTCQHCHLRIPYDALTCPHCGRPEPVDPDEAPHAAPPRPPPPPIAALVAQLQGQHRPRRRGRWRVVALVLLGGLGLAGLWLGRRGAFEPTVPETTPETTPQMRPQARVVAAAALAPVVAAPLSPNLVSPNVVSPNVVSQTRRPTVEAGRRYYLAGTDSYRGVVACVTAEGLRRYLAATQEGRDADAARLLLPVGERNHDVTEDMARLLQRQACTLVSSGQRDAPLHLQVEQVDGELVAGKLYNTWAWFSEPTFWTLRRYVRGDAVYARDPGTRR